MAKQTAEARSPRGLAEPRVGNPSQTGKGLAIKLNA